MSAVASPAYAGSLPHVSSNSLARYTTFQPTSLPFVDPDDGLSRLGLYEAVAVAGPARNGNKVQRDAESRNTMDWLDLTRASGGAVGRVDVCFPS